MKKIVAFGSGNALAAICGVINSNPQSDMSVHRVVEVKDKPISLEDL